MLRVLLFTLRVDEEVIQIGCKEFIKHIHEKVINVALEGCWPVGKAEWHDLIMEAAVSGPKRCKVFRIWVNSNLMEGLVDINLGHDFRLQELRKYLINQQEWVRVLLGDF